MDKYNFLVCVHCMTFNHAPYIVDTMNGFTMQETSFPYVCCIIDDASTDGEPEVIRKYLQDNFDLEDKSVVRNDETDDYVLCFARHKTNKNCFFAVFWLKYNHYSIKKTKRVYLDEWDSNSKYIALCEGDDYWIHPRKLQMQVDFLESHCDCTMVCNRTKLYSVKQNRFIGENYCYKKSQIVDAKDVILRGGLFISTCSIIYRPEVKNDYPDYCAKCKVGDYPLQIMCAMKGKVYYFNDIMSVYRVQNSESWMGQNKWGKHDEIKIEVIRSQIDMFNGFKNDFPMYAKVLKNKVASHINVNFPISDDFLETKEKYIKIFGEEIREYSLRWKIDLRMRVCRISIVRRIYKNKRFFGGKYRQRKILY